MNNDPWINIDAPSVVNQFGTNRVDKFLKWNIFWAISFDRKYSLLIWHDEEYSKSETLPKIPKLQGMEVITIPGGNSGRTNLIFKLSDSEQKEIFHNFCVDIIESAKDSSSGKEVIARSIGRAWRWHHLLRGGSDGRLSNDDQKGLIGELIVLEKLLLSNMTPSESLSCWAGPTGSPKDFEIGDICIESKARRGAATPFISISNEFQLDESTVKYLYLHVAQVNPAPKDTPGSFTLTDFVTRIGDEFIGTDPDAISEFEHLLSASGFQWNHDYSQNAWIQGNSDIYLVDEEFPKITPDNFKSGISRVHYSVSLSDISEFSVEFDSVNTHIGESVNG